MVYKSLYKRWILNIHIVTIVSGAYARNVFVGFGQVSLCSFAKTSRETNPSHSGSMSNFH